MSRRRLAVLVAVPALFFVTVSGSCVYAIANLDLNGRRDATPEQVEKLQRHRKVLSTEGDRLLVEAGVPSRGTTNSCDFDPAHRPPTYETRDAPPELRAALEDFGVTERYVSYCTVVFQIPGSVGFGADNANTLLYGGTELYTRDASCEGVMGATNAAAPIDEDWYVGYALHC